MNFSEAGGKGMRNSGETSITGEGTGLGRILDKDFFFYLFDLEVKRARRYQNYISILLLNLAPVSGNRQGGGNGDSLRTCLRTLTNVLLDETRETDILGSLGENKLAALLPYADVSAGGQAKSRFESTLKYYDFRTKGYQVHVHQFCFPRNGTVTADYIRKALSSEPATDYALNCGVPPKLDG